MRQLGTRSETNPKLSICIPTRNRAGFIGGMLESLIWQIPGHCEIVVLDGASTDDTGAVVQRYAHGCDQLRYIRQEENGGIDQDIDRVVQLANGEYCWLVPDDDFVRPGAVARVLDALARDYSLVIVNVDVRDASLSTVLSPNLLGIHQDYVFSPGDMDGLFRKVGAMLGYLGCGIIKRSIWIERERSRYYGSYFVHLGVMFQRALPGETHVIAQPLISVRAANQSWLEWQFEITMIYWPSLVLSFPLDERTKRKACTARRWVRLGNLLSGRARGRYSFNVYQRSFRPRFWSRWQKLVHSLIAVMPIWAAAVLSTVHSVFSQYTLSVQRAGFALLRKSKPGHG